MRADAFAEMAMPLAGGSKLARNRQRYRHERRLAQTVRRPPRLADRSDAEAQPEDERESRSLSGGNFERTRSTSSTTSMTAASASRSPATWRPTCFTTPTPTSSRTHRGVPRRRLQHLGARRSADAPEVMLSDQTLTPNTPHAPPDASTNDIPFAGIFSMTG